MTIFNNVHSKAQKQKKTKNHFVLIDVITF